ncbi:MAG: hypothetical protein RR397_02645 [Odoribacter sp.]
MSAIYNKPFDVPYFDIANLTSADLDKYLGVYSSPQFPLKVTISKQDKTLIGQGTGQVEFELFASAENTFKFDRADIIMIFDPGKGTMLLKQEGKSFLMKKE